MSHKNSNAATVGQIYVEDLAALKSIQTIKGAGAEATEHRNEIEEGMIVLVRQPGWPAIPFSPVQVNTVAAYCWTPASMGWDTGNWGPAPGWEEVYTVRPNDTDSAEPGRWLNIVPLQMLAMLYEEGPGGDGGGMGRLRMGEGMWYDNGDGLGISSNNDNDIVQPGYWFAVPFRVDHETTFTDVGIECVNLADGGALLGFAVYENNGGMPTPAGLKAFLGNLGGCAFGGNILSFAMGAPGSVYQQPLTLDPGWYWLAFTQDTSAPDNNFRCFGATMVPSEPNEKNANTAHLGYYDVVQTEGIFMVKTNSGGYDAQSPPSDFWDSGPATLIPGEPLRIMLKVGGGGYPEFNIEDEDGSTINAPMGIFTDSGGLGGNYLPSEDFTTTVNVNGDFRVLKIWHDIDTSGNDMLTLTNPDTGTSESFAGVGGDAQNPLIISTSNYSTGKVHLSWHSDPSSPGAPGFGFIWEKN